jgi:two-component system chemotaxis sensor kinase CheA
VGAPNEPISRSSARAGEAFVSVASRLAVIIFALVAAVSALVAFELTRREEEHYIESKRLAGVMLTELWAASVAPALDFADTDAIATSVGMLAQNRDVVDAAVWSNDDPQPLGGLHQRGPLAAGADHRPGVRVGRDHIDIARAVKSPVGKPLGTVLVRVSLAQENAAFATARQRIFWLASALSALVAALLVGVVRRTIISPLAALERAARRLARGELTEVIDLRSDEVGRLGHTFNQMGRVIREREERIFAVNTRLQGLLDTMRQAIVVFDGAGRLGSERSRLARQIFGDASGAATNVVDLLYPAERAPAVEREAFRAWLDAAAATPPEGFDELSELAPREVQHRSSDGQERLLELEFRSAAGDDGAQRVMLLATDMTSQRTLERTAEAREREHKKQLAALRRLLAGGGQVFVRFLASTRERLARADHEVAGTGPLSAEAVEHAFRFVHTLRAESRSFDLAPVEELALGLELELSGTRHTPADSPLRRAVRTRLQTDFRKLASLLAEAEAVFVEGSPIGRRVLEQVTVARSDVEQLYKRFGERPDELGRIVSRLASRPFGEIASTLPDEAVRWASKAHKRVVLSVVGRETLVPGRLAERLSGVLAHLVRNAVAHGIEAPEQREELGKPPLGRIELECRETPRGVEIRVSDDGAGFDTGALGGAGLERAFAPGVSTRSTPDELGGFGVGLGAVRDELKQVGYLVELKSENGTGASVLIEPISAPRDQSWPISPSSS